MATLKQSKRPRPVRSPDGSLRLVFIFPERKNAQGVAWALSGRLRGGRNESRMENVSYPDMPDKGALLFDRFVCLLEQHVAQLSIRGSRAHGCCPFHDDRHPSFSADVERGVWYCFGCGQGGGVRDFALRVGEEWQGRASGTPADRAAYAVRARRRQAERQARAILQQRQEEQNKALCAAHRETYGRARAAADLLTIFYRRPHLADEFPALLAQTEEEYGAALFQLTVLAGKLDGDIA